MTHRLAIRALDGRQLFCDPMRFANLGANHLDDLVPLVSALRHSALCIGAVSWGNSDMGSRLASMPGSSHARLFVYARGHPRRAASVTR